MCTVSDQLKLCTCKPDEVEKLKHYWVLRRPNNGKNILIGEIIFPKQIGECTDRINKNKIQNQLNTGSCFDVDLLNQENDILELYFTLDTNAVKPKKILYIGGYLAYSFKFKKGKWINDNYDPFEVNAEEIQSGKILNPFSKVE